MKYRYKLIVIAAVMACGILVQCGADKKQGLLQGPVMSINQLPVAKAGADKNIYLYTGSADLDGSKSFDPEGKDLSYSWEIVHRPSGSAASFSDPANVKTTLTFDTAGTYEIMLTVSDGSRTASDLVTVNVGDNTGAAANAGPDQEVGFGDIVVLDGSGSTDPEGDPLTYTWTQVSGPAVGVGTLSGANPTFVAPSEACTIVYDLSVDDGSGSSLPDRVYVFVMKNAGAGIYVATTGDDGNDGTDRAAPKRTIQAALSAALAAGSDVYVSDGDYGESLTLADGVSIYGGFLHTTWERDTVSFRSSVQGGTIAVDGNGVNDLVIDGLSITSASATIAGAGSYAVRLISSSVEFNNCIITAGNGAPGQDGTDGTDGQAGGSGGNGQNGDEDGAGGAGGSGGTGYNGNSGGGGGKGIYEANGEDGQYGLKNGNPITYGGIGGLKGRPGEQGDYGTAGLNGYSGTNGPAGTSGSLIGNLWVSSNGTAGTDGEAGCGGGGGGGGGGQFGGFLIPGGGNGGGGGGGGGGRGTHGTGGTGGGASFGLLLIDSVITVSRCDISSGTGGNGGRGGTGGTGAAGGSGGSGASHATDEIGAGGNGGAGGHGGNGGHGGGGAGGPSFGIYKSGISMANVTLSRVVFSSAGSGGASSGNPGTDGDGNSSN